MNLFLLGASASGGLEAEAARTSVRGLLADLPFLAGRPVEAWGDGGLVAAWCQHDPAELGGVSYAATAHDQLGLFAGRPIRWVRGGVAGLRERPGLPAVVGLASRGGVPARVEPARTDGEPPVVDGRGGLPARVEPARADGEPPVVDGRGPLDAREYLAPAELWAPGLDGRAVVARLDRAARGGAAALELWTDPLGAYPVFRAQAGGARWFSSSAELLRRVTGDDALDLDALASLVGVGWPLDGHPVWAAVRRVPRGVLLRLGADGRETTEEHLPLADLARLYGAAPAPTGPRAGSEGAGDAAARLVAVTAALADWPGRPSVVPITGGRDSRVVLAAAGAAGFPRTVTTAGGDHEPDVIIGREVAAAAGEAWAPFALPPGGSRGTHPLPTLRLTALLGGGTVSAGDGSGFPLADEPGPRLLWHTGQGGEVARGYYGRARLPTRAGLTAQLWVAATAWRPGRSGILGADGRSRVRGSIRRWVDEVSSAGVRAGDVPDAFYLLRRMGTWAGPTFGPPEWVRDSTAPLWTAGLLGDLLAGSAADRAQERYAEAMVLALAPDLLDLPFQGGRPWPSRTSGLARRTARARTLARKAHALSAARLAARRAAPAPHPAAPEAGGVFPNRPPEPVGAHTPAPAATASAPQALAVAHAWLAERALADGGHPVWAVLDRERTEALLRTPPHLLDTLAESLVWRLATVWALRELAPG